MSEPVCPVCGGSRSREHFAVETTSRFTIRSCRGCGLAFAWPRPTEAELAQFYSRDYFARPAGARSSLGYEDYAGTSLAAENARAMWRQINAWEPRIAGLFPRTLLDVGCATGDFGAQAVGDGWDVTGVELSDYAREIAAGQGLTTARQLVDLEPEFGLITMFHVLEHVVDPVQILRQARRLIAPSGWLLAEVPHWRSAGRIVRGARWGQLRPPEHINFFIARSISRTFELAGWRLVRTATPYPRPADLAREARRAHAYVRAAAFGTAATILSRSRLGGYLRVIATPGGTARGS